METLVFFATKCAFVLHVSFSKVPQKSFLLITQKTQSLRITSRNIPLGVQGVSFSLINWTRKLWMRKDGSNSTFSVIMWVHAFDHYYKMLIFSSRKLISVPNHS